MDSGSKVQSFYETKGWSSNAENQSVDAQLFEDLRACARSYLERCRKKLIHELPASGVRMLDAASGPLQYPEYLEYSKNFKKRVCLDFSLGRVCISAS